MIGKAVWPLVVVLAAWHGSAAAEIVTMTQSQLTTALPEGWKYQGVGVSPFHPGVSSDVIVAPGAEAHVFLSMGNCPRPADGERWWRRAQANLLSAELDVVWQSRLRDAEQGCYATRRGELVIVVTAADPATWDRASSQRLSDALVEAGNGPQVSAAVAEARLRASDPGRGVPVALSLGAQLSLVGDRDAYRNAWLLYEAAGRLGIVARPIVVRIEGEVGRASTNALRFDVELGIGPALVRDDLVASFTIGAAMGGQTASDGDTFELPEDPIPIRLRIPLVAEAGKRLGSSVAGSARLRVAWLTTDEVRRAGGSPTLGSDELTVEGRLYFGRPRHSSFLLGAALDESLGTRMFVVTVGVGATPF